MSRDNWERLVAAVIKREQIWQLCHDHSRSPSISTISSDFSQEILSNSLEPNSASPLTKPSVFQDVQNLPCPPKEQSDKKQVNFELPSGIKAVRKATMHMQSRLRPWVAFWNMTKPSSKKTDLLISGGSAVKAPDADSTGNDTSPVVRVITVDRTVEFSFEELRDATNDFSIEYKIAEDVFGSIYYSKLRGEKAAIKKMGMQASKEFLTELNVLTHVHHRNMVRLIGYCVEGSLFLVYEYIENGNLSQHLHDSGRQPLPWSTRIQIALDSARCLEHIHEHTVPIYIHRDIRPANILIDKNFHGKVANFRLSRLTEVGSSSLQPVVGTFGYMPPEYAQYGDVSPKIDVYAFGVVLYELISAKEAIVEENGSAADSRALSALFEEVLSELNLGEDLRKLVDPRLGDSYPFDSVLKVAHLAKACTHENPELRPSMRSVVIALMTLLSSTENWDVGSFYENQGLLHLVSRR